MAEDNRIKQPHNLILEDRTHLSVTGVEDIDSFDEQTVVLFTGLGELLIKGEDLHINKLNIDTGEVTMEGKIHTMIYSNDEPKQKGLLSKLFR